MDSEVQVHFEMLMPVTFRAFYSFWQEKRKRIFYTSVISIQQKMLATLGVAKSVTQMTS